MKLIIGLGNPGKKYEKTRHNFGFLVLDALLQDLAPLEKTSWQKDKKINALIAKINDLILIKPQTMMNNSGVAVAKIAHFYKIKLKDIWIIHDDIDLPLGKIKIVQARGAAGHKGVESIIKELGSEEVTRFRLGIGRPGYDLTEKEAVSYVLSPFNQTEKKKAKVLIKKAKAVIKNSLESSVEKAMNRYN